MNHTQVIRRVMMRMMAAYHPGGGAPMLEDKVWDSIMDEALIALAPPTQSTEAFLMILLGRIQLRRRA